MKTWKNGVVAALLAVFGVLNAQAGTVTCGDPTLGVRVTTVDPALTPGGLCYAGLTNLGDGALVTLLNSLISPDTAGLIDRDDANTNGGLLSITGVGLASGGWSLDSSLWSSYERMFLYFHFGDARDCSTNCSTSLTDPDIFIVELMSPDAVGTWAFGPVGASLNGLSNIALLGVAGEQCVPSPENGNCGQQQIPEPGSLSLAALALLGAWAVRRRRSA
jgi:hypothetical protein